MRTSCFTFFLGLSSYSQPISDDALFRFNDTLGNSRHCKLRSCRKSCPFILRQCTGFCSNVAAMISRFIVAVAVDAEDASGSGPFCRCSSWCRIVAISSKNPKPQTAWLLFLECAVGLANLLAVSPPNFRSFIATELFRIRLLDWCVAVEYKQVPYDTTRGTIFGRQVYVIHTHVMHSVEVVSPV
jgi:hypothetical protein